MTHSPTGTTRHADIEAGFRKTILETVLATPDPAALRTVLLDKVFGVVTFLELPKYRQAALEGYFLGICDILAKISPAAVARPSGVVMKRKPGRPRQTPPPQKPKSLPSALLSRIDALPRRSAALTIVPPAFDPDRQKEN